MPHYKDGTPAHIGDYVKGTGYNVQDKDGKPVIGITPDSASCNIQVAHPVAVPYSLPVNSHIFETKGVLGCGPEGDNGNSRCGAYLDLEYGQCDAFELIYRR